VEFPGAAIGLVTAADRPRAGMLIREDGVCQMLQFDATIRFAILPERDGHLAEKGDLYRVARISIKEQ